MKKFNYKWLVVILFPLFSACGVMYPNRMFDADKNYLYESFLDSVPSDFTISPGDDFELYVYPEKGYNLIEPQIVFQGNTQQAINTYSLQYSVSQTGEANVPILGFVKLAGLTEIEAEKKLSGMYKGNYVDPFVNLRLVSDKTVTVYRGSSDAQKVVLARPDMTLLEVIGEAGGVPQDAKSSHIKIIRNSGDSALVQDIDLSKIEGMEQANKYIRPNDVIYIEPGLNPQFFEQVAPIISTVTGIVVIYAYFSNLNSK